MKWALLLAEWPMKTMPDAGLVLEWNDLLERVQEVRKLNPKIEEIHAGAWQIPLNEGLRQLTAMCRAVDGVQGSSWGHRVLFFEEIPPWIFSRSERS
jgi:hypothetical protein